MTRTTWAPRRWTAAAGALVTAFAVAVPLAGAASANHGTTQLAISPTSDVAAVGTCNAYTVTSNLVEGTLTNIDVLISQTGPAGLTIGFCNPGAAGGPNPTGPDVGPAAPTGNQLTTAPTQTGGTTQPTGAGCERTTPPAAGATATVTCHAEFTPTFVNTVGGVNQYSFTFGVWSNQAGNMNVLAFLDDCSDCQNNDQPDPFELQAPATKTWVAGGTAGVTAVDCTPETDTNPEDTTHAFLCTATATNPQTGANTVPVEGAQISFDVIAGPNAEEVGAQFCTGGTAGGVTTGGTTNAQGQAVCEYDDNDTSGFGTAGVTVNSPPGTDTIVGYVEQAAAAGQPGGPGRQAHEPADEILKTWQGEARFIDCVPETAQNPSGTQHLVTCTVTDISGQPIAGQDVAFTESGPGRITSPTRQQGTGGGLQSAYITETDAAGQAQVITATTAGETGLQTITGQLAFGCIDALGGGFTNCDTAANTANTQECEQTATQTNNAPGGGTGTAPAGTAAGVCADTVTKQWGPTPTPTVTSTTTATATATATTTATATATTTGTSTPPPSACVGATQASVNVAITGATTILAGQGTTVRATAPAGSTVQLLARTSGGTYAVVRTATVPATGFVDFLVTPRYTTRVAARACNFTSLAQPIISVRARVSLAVTPLAGCVLRFTGATLPVKPGQVVNIYYRSGGASTLAMQTRTSTTGTYVAQRRFFACGRTLTFFARVNADVHNLAGQSADRVATIRA